jgi:(p)ppGpp synthase/HD superfamily hydrolase
VQKAAKPSSKWLDFVKTSIARNRIKQALKGQSLADKFRDFLR